MKVATVKLESVSPYSQSKYIQVEKLPREIPRDYEARCWRERMHATSDGHVFIPPMAFANAIKEAAKYLSLQVPGKGKSTYTKHFEAGVMVSDPVVLPDLKEEVEGEWLLVPSDGKRGGGTRVEKCFPVIPEWSGEVTFYILDDIITKDVFVQVLKVAGSLIGIGRFRPRNCGYYGRFKVASCEWGEAA